MNLIIPMAGRGSRLRPHTLTTPKPLVPIAGKPIVQWLIEMLSQGLDEPFEEIAFVIGDFGEGVKEKLKEVSRSVGSKPHIFYQEKPLGPAHAIHCARPVITGPSMVALADTLFITDFSFDQESEGVIWTQKVKNPENFGVVKTNSDGVITEFVEKSPNFVSDQAIVGIYYFRDGDNFRNKLDFLLENEIREKGEYQITTVLELLKNDGLKFKTASIDEWLDCGNKEAIIHTNERILDTQIGENIIEQEVVLKNSTVIEPCFIGRGAVIKNSVVGPFVSVGAHSRIVKSVVEKSVIQDESKVKFVNLKNSMIGNQAEYIEKARKISLGDYSRLS